MSIYTLIPLLPLGAALTLALFGRRLHGRFGLEVEMTDERLSSFEAKQSLQQQGHRGDYKASPVDSYAAELILQTWMREAGHL